MRGFVITVLALLTGLFCSSVIFLPEIGDPQSAPNQHITPVYISQSEIDTGSPNIVTGTLADYRGFDTIGESFILLASIAGSYAILRSSKKRKEEQNASV